jgi:hypothetical protein
MRTGDPEILDGPGVVVPEGGELLDDVEPAGAEQGHRCSQRAELPRTTDRVEHHPRSGNAGAAKDHFQWPERSQLRVLGPEHLLEDLALVGERCPHGPCRELAGGNTAAQQRAGDRPG